MNFKKNQGFTLVELIVVIAILGLLAGIGIPAYSGYVEKAQIAVDKQNVVMLSNVFNVACADAGVSPARVSFDVIMEGQVFKGINVTAVNPLAMYRRGGEDDTAGAETTDKATKIENTFNELKGPDITFKKLTAAEVKAGILNPDSIIGASGAADTGVFGQIFEEISESISGSVSKVQTSTFGPIGAQGLMTKVDTVTELAAGLAGINNDFKQALAANSNDLAVALGLDPTSETFTADYTAKMNELVNQIAPGTVVGGVVQDSQAFEAATNQILANYAVLQAAKSTTKTSDQLLNDLQEGIDSEDIKNLMTSKDTANTQEGLSKAAMMYAMYTAYANQMPETTDEEKAAKEEALEAAKTTEGFLANMNSDGFNTYLQNADGQAKTDLEGYLGALDIINQSADNDSAAVADLLVNGYNDPTLIAALQGLLGK